jgi:hypothetical protein
MRILVINDKGAFHIMGCTFVVSHRANMLYHFFMNNKNLGQRGFLPLLGIIVVAITLVVGGYYWEKSSERAESIPQVTQIQNVPSAPANSESSVNAKQITANQNLKSATYAYVYQGPSSGFSAQSTRDGEWVVPRSVDMSQYKIGGLTPLLAWVYGTNPKTNVTAYFIVGAAPTQSCLSGPDSITKNQNNLNIVSKNSSDAAMGHYENTYARSISNGENDYCIVGLVKGTRPYDLEGNAYDDQEKINSNAIKAFEADLKLFVDTFKIL